jgi:hypothetical protein
MRSLVTDQLMSIISTVILNDTEERTILLRSRYELLDFDCYEKVVKYYSKNCFSIAKVITTN